MERVTGPDKHECIRLSNDDVYVEATIDVGPRIVTYSRVGGENVLGEAFDVAIETTLGTWRPYAGHRLWAAPEANPFSYAPDNDPVDVHEIGERAVRLVARPQAGLQKSMTITLADKGSNVTIVHRITNHSLPTIEIAPWALTIVGAGGEAIVPNEPAENQQKNTKGDGGQKAFHKKNRTPQAVMF
ncbi:MAG: hypothetical protein H7X80_06305 [bacterium]|nr:hypothetical protein [Candidatus Kapabacteria bacterium]